MKKEYCAPELMVHGDVAKATQADGYVFNSDVPKGHPNTAYPAVSPSGVIVTG